MKRLLLVAMGLVLLISAGVLAADGNPYGTLTENVDAFVTVGPYANVFAQKVVIEPSGWWLRWGEGTVGMDFGYYNGQAGYGKVADSNSFILETNTDLLITFSGQSLTHASGEKMLTRYWAWLSRGVDDLPQPYLLINVPDQIQPYKEIGYFGEAGNAPRKESGREVEQIIFDVLEWIAGRDFWPQGKWTEEVVQTYNGVTTNGFYAFQVFGFASTDDISSQPEGDYQGKIIMTVSK
ncbi:MAG: hypothetical protein GX971_13215 [Firmicutes bacterium]|nr:hypothetical protein [Bacillota bacterium]